MVKSTSSASSSEKGGMSHAALEERWSLGFRLKWEGVQGPRETQS